MTTNDHPMIRSRSRLLFAAFCSALLAACGGPRPYAAVPIEDDAELVSNVVVTTPGLHDVIRVGRAGVERVEGSNQLRVVVPIRNIGGDAVQVRVQVSFLDIQRRPIGDATNQQVQILSPGMTVDHVALSKSDRARDWTMRIIPND